MSKKELKTYYIAYFDILGYKSFFDDNENDVQDFLQCVIKACHDTYQSNSYTNNQICNANITVKTFSDNFIIMSETCKDLPDHTMLNYFAQILSKLQLNFLE